MEFARCGSGAALHKEHAVRAGYMRVLGSPVARALSGADNAALLAFGTIRPERVIACTEERATIFAGGDIAADERYVHRIPLPASRAYRCVRAPDLRACRDSTRRFLLGIGAGA